MRKGLTNDGQLENVIRTAKIFKLIDECRKWAVHITPGRLFKRLKRKK